MQRRQRQLRGDRIRLEHAQVSDDGSRAAAAFLDPVRRIRSGASQ
jgi:hypothetical protein